jgi:signal transduction histidine kinase
LASSLTNLGNSLPAAGLGLPTRNGIGLTSMRQRAEALDGTFAVSSDGRGTTIRATLPLGRSQP